MRAVNFTTPGLGGPQVIWRRDGSQGPAFAFRGTGGYQLSWLNGARKGTGTTKMSGKSFGPREGNCDQFFSSTLWDEDRHPDGTDRLSEKNRRGTDSFVKGLILAQNERWRRGLGMQVERAW